jgi:hypothetical protein
MDGYGAALLTMDRRGNGENRQENNYKAHKLIWDNELMGFGMVYYYLAECPVMA